MIELGGTQTLTYSVLNTAGTLVTPTTITLTITLPDLTTVTPTPVTGGTGLYSYDYVPAVAGRYSYRWATTGPATAGVDTFLVVDSTACLVSMSEVKEHLNITATTYDRELARFRDMAEAAAEQYTNASLRRRQISGELASGGQPSVILRNRPVQSITAVTENGYALTAGFYRLNPPAGVLMRTSGYPYYPTLWLNGYLNVSVDYVAGYGNNAPQDLKHGVLEIVRALWEASQRGSGTRRPGVNESTWQPTGNFPPDVTALLDPYVELGVA